MDAATVAEPELALGFFLGCAAAGIEARRWLGAVARRERVVPVPRGVTAPPGYVVVDYDNTGVAVRPSNLCTTCNGSGHMTLLHGPVGGRINVPCNCINRRLDDHLAGQGL